MEIRFEEAIRKVLIVVVLVITIISICGLYYAINEFISIWIGYKFAPIYRILLNLGVLIISLYVLSKYLKR